MYDLAGTVPANPTTGSNIGQTCTAYLASRFPNPAVAPAPNAAPPAGGADAISVLSTAGGAFFIKDAVPAFVTCMVSFTDPNDGAHNVYWIGPLLPTALSPLPVLVNDQDQTANRNRAWSTLDASMQGLTLPQSSVKLASTAEGWSKPGFAFMAINGVGPTVWELIHYTDLDATHLLNCSGGSGSIAFVNGPVLQAYVNGSLPRRVTVSLQFKVTTNTDYSFAVDVSDTGGKRGYTGWAGIQKWLGTFEFDLLEQLTFDVDPGGAYAIYPAYSAGGGITIARWQERDVPAVAA